jgi:hypothetical protein
MVERDVDVDVAALAADAGVSGQGRCLHRPVPSRVSSTCQACSA